MPFHPLTARAIAALSVTQLIGWGATFWMPAVTGPAMAGDLGLSLPMVMAGPTVMLMVMALASWPLGTLFERYGARPIMAVGPTTICGFSVGMSDQTGKKPDPTDW